MRDRRPVLSLALVSRLLTRTSVRVLGGATALTCGMVILTMAVGNTPSNAADTIQQHPPAKPSQRSVKASVPLPSSRAVLRRMNRTEYEYTLRDLLHLPGLNVKEMLPDDGRANGYDKCGTGLEISSVQMAKYLEAADYALSQAIAPRLNAPQVYKTCLYPTSQYDYGILLSNGDCVFLKDGKFDPRVPLITDKWHDFGQMSRDGLFKIPGSVGIFRHQDEAFGGRFSQFSPVHAGLYRIRISLWSFWWEKGEVQAALRCGGPLLRQPSPGASRCALPQTDRA